MKLKNREVVLRSYCEHQTGVTICPGVGPSPRPSPAGRGGIVPSDLAKPRLNSAPRLTNDNKAVNGCSLSPRERVRVRGSGMPKLGKINHFPILT
jgi:hypothetical protein